MAISRGKQFEWEIKNQLLRVPEISVDRIYDVTTGFVNQNTLCDFIVFKDRILHYFECKAIKGATLNFKSHIRENQWEGLVEKSTIPFVNAGILCWFIDYDKTVFISIDELVKLKKQGKKSFHILKDIDTVPIIKLEGKKRRVFFNYDFETFFRQIYTDFNFSNKFIKNT